MDANRKRFGLKETVAGLIAVIIINAAAVMNQTAQPQPAADNEYTVGAILWMQSSGEYRALAYQAYNFARILLDRDLKENRRNKRRRAIVVDADETILDNSRYQASLALAHKGYTAQGWADWVSRAEAGAVPGAVEFLRYANQRGVKVFYVTNRRVSEKEATATNLKRLGFPEVNDETLLVRTDDNSSSKEPRRLAIEARYRIVLLMGDNLNDFAEVFEKKTVADRLAAVDRERAEFGTRFIVLPNPMYGDWESAIYEYNFKLSEEEKAAKRRQLLKTY